MNNRLVEHIISDLRQYGKRILIVDDIHDFLGRKDIQSIFDDQRIVVNSGSVLSQRISFCLDKSNTMHLFIEQSGYRYLEDMEQRASRVQFRISDYLGNYHLETVLGLGLDDLEKLYHIDSIERLNAKETKALLREEGQNGPVKKPDIGLVIRKVSKILDEENVNWHMVVSLLSEVILADPANLANKEFSEFIDGVNNHFQRQLEENYKNLISSNPIRRPQLVSKILPHIASNYDTHDKVALVVIDGFSYWQYKLLSHLLEKDFKVVEDVTYAWIPTITQLSRQAIFRGDTPDKEYVQNPRNERVLWKNYWVSKGFGGHTIDYQHDPTEYQVSSLVKRLAVVFKDLDEKMHSSTDYVDLLDLTKNWVKRSDIIRYISKLTDDGFHVILTTDHGNIEATGWRRLSGREKLGTNRSGSRSQRHLEYTEDWLVRDFIDQNEDILGSLAMDEQAIYFKDRKSFSSEDKLVTHGGSHILEVLIPFIKINKS